MTRQSAMRCVPFALVCAALLWVGLNPEPVPQVFAQQDKLHHALGFFAFAVTLKLAFPGLGVVRLVAVGAAAALLIEVGQGFLPARTASLADMAANLIGVLLGGACARAVDATSALAGSHRAASAQKNSPAKRPQ